MNDTPTSADPAGPEATLMLAHVIAEQKAFRADLNHKLRTPLNAIIGFAELVALQPGTVRRNDDVQQILKSAREMLAIIERELTECAEQGAVGLPGAKSAPEHSCEVLYVEDDPVNFMLVQRILEFRPELRVMHAPRGQVGVEMAGAYQPKLVLLDLNLPDMNGAEVLHRLQQQRSTATIPVVILSADATPSQIERLLTAGAKNYLTKPFDIDPFLAVVDEFVAASRGAV